MGLESGFQVTPNAAMERTIEIDLQMDNRVFEVPILGARMRGLPCVSHFLMFLKNHQKIQLSGKVAHAATLNGDLKKSTIDW